VATWARLFFLMAVCAVALTGGAVFASDFEVGFSADDFKRLDTYEAHTLSKADASYAKGDFKRALAEYDAFLVEFPDSVKAVPYALMRKARCLHKGLKRYEAVKVYQEVLDLFPNAVTYAAPSLYYQGLAHWENGEMDQAVAKWVKMASDPEYNRHYLGATAFTQLADQLVKQGKPDQAAQYYELVAKNFRTSNAASANYAIGELVKHYIRTSPNEAKLRQLYKELKTFHGNPRSVDEDLTKSRDYWDVIRLAVKRHASFGEKEESLRKNYYRYWAEALDGKFSDWDDYQIDLASFYLVVEGDTVKWIERLDKQFKAHQKADDFDRLVRWIKMFKAHKGKVDEYYQKVVFEKMTNPQIVSLMMFAYGDLNNAVMGRTIYGKVRLAEMPDEEKVLLGAYFWKIDPSLLGQIYGSMKDKELADMQWLKYYAAEKDDAKAVPLADKLSVTEKFGKDARQIKADLLYAVKKYEQAIRAYQACDNPPLNLFRIADCYVAMQQYKRAVEQLTEIENFFVNSAPGAAMRIAHVYNVAGQTDMHIASLRAVLKKYPKSGESRSAHLELERMNVRIGGGVDAEK
jgi:tetratricopeptide (TPR) repeat protein